MLKTLSRKSILRKTFQVGGNTLISRLLGLAREILQMRFLGIGIANDAFNTAFMIPNSLRKMFAEGALTAAFVPTFVNVYKKEGTKEANKLMTLSLLAFESLVLLICALVMWKTEFTLRLFAPGFSGEQIASAIPCLKILMPFIFFISTSSLLTGALQSVNHFFIPSFAPALLNLFYIGGIIICLIQGYTIEYLSWVIMIGGLVQFLLHVWMYLKLGFSLQMPTKESYKSFLHIVAKFLPCFFSMSVMEINLIIDNIFASYGSVGTVTLIKYTSRLMGIPLGVFSTAFSTILLPHFSRVAMYAPRRLSFYLLEAAKFILWITAPATLIMCYLADDIFLTLFASSSSKFPIEVVPVAGWMLIGYLIGLFWISVNKILLTLFYSFHDTFRPTYTAVIATILNYGFNFIFFAWWGGLGIPFATTLSGIVQMFISLYLLHRYHNFKLYIRHFMSFASRYLLQMVLLAVPALGLYKIVRYGVEIISSNYHWLEFFMIKSFGYWIWAMPVILIYFYGLYATKRIFKVKLYFLK